MKKRFLILSVVFCMVLQIPVAAAGLTGSCGEDVTYSFNKKTNILTLSGSGPLYDYECYNDLPWYGYSTKIEHVKLNGGIEAPLWILNRKIAVACGRVKKDKIQSTAKAKFTIADDTGHVFSGDIMDSKNR